MVDLEYICLYERVVSASDGANLEAQEVSNSAAQPEAVEGYIRRLQFSYGLPKSMMGLYPFLRWDPLKMHTRIRGIGRVQAATNGELTTLEWLNQEGDDHVIH